MAIRFLTFLLTATVIAAQTAPAILDTPGSYTLGPGDEVSVSALDVEELKTGNIRLDMQGTIRLPLIGKIQAAEIGRAHV